MLTVFIFIDLLTKIIIKMIIDSINQIGYFIIKSADGTIITFRPTTKSYSNPGVDINVIKSTNSEGLKTQKIHFEDDL